MKMKIAPVGAEVERLRINTGLTFYHHNGEMQLGHLRHNGNIIQVWFFKHENIVEEVVRQAMIRNRAQMYGISEAKAAEFLLTHDSAIPCSQVVVSVESESGS